MKHTNVRKVGYASAVTAITSIVSSPWVTVASLALQGFSMLQSSKYADKAAEEAQKQAQMQERINAVNAARARTESIRESRIRSAQILTAGAAGDVAGSSSVETGIGSVGSQSINAQDAINQRLGFATAMGESQTKQADYMGSAQGWKDLGSFSSSMFTASGGFSNLKNLSSTGTTTAKPTMGFSTFANAPYPVFG